MLTDQQLHAFPALMGVGKALPGGAHYPLHRIARMTVDKLLMVSHLHVVFADGSAVELDLAKQRVKTFVEAAQNADPGLMSTRRGVRPRWRRVALDDDGDRRCHHRFGGAEGAKSAEPTR